MTLANLISTISAIDSICVKYYDSCPVFKGMCGDFRATVDSTKRDEYLNATVDRVRAYNDTIIIELKEED